MTSVSHGQNGRSADRLRRGLLALGGGVVTALLIAGIVVSALLVPVRRFQADRAARDDPERCPLVHKYPHTEVGLAIWNAQDSCAYFDSSDRRAAVDFPATIAGPVLRHRAPVTHDGLPQAVAGLAIVVVLAGICFSELRDAGTAPALRRDA
jgi:hypothetical protein